MYMHKLILLIAVNFNMNVNPVTVPDNMYVILHNIMYVLSGDVDLHLLCYKK